MRCNGVSFIDRDQKARHRGEAMLELVETIASFHFASFWLLPIADERNDRFLSLTVGEFEPPNFFDVLTPRSRRGSIITLFITVAEPRAGISLAS